MRRMRTLCPLKMPWWVISVRRESGVIGGLGGDAIILIKSIGAVAAGINVKGERILWKLADVLLQLAEGQNGALPNVDRHLIQGGVPVGNQGSSINRRIQPGSIIFEG